jgi:thiamine-phosphate pyrophosphorylase
VTPVSDLRLHRREQLRAAGVYLVTEEALSGSRSSEEVAAAALAAGVGIIQVREKQGTTRRALEIALALRIITRARGALLLVNDRLDIARAAEADGVHLGQDDIPVAAARAILGPDAMIGLSITSADQLRAPDVGGADYLGVGAVFPTRSKVDARDTGLQLLAAARAAVDLPIVAIGGITLENAALVVRAGADVLAVITAITASPDPGASARRLLDAVRVAGGKPRERAGLERVAGAGRRKPAGLEP